MSSIRLTVEQRDASPFAIQPCWPSPIMHLPLLATEKITFQKGKEKLIKAKLIQRKLDNTVECSDIATYILNRLLQWLTFF